MKPRTRRNDDGERINKLLIVSCTCACSVFLVLAVSVQAYRGVEIPDSLDRLAFLVLGAMVGFLGKTSTTPTEGQRQPPSGQEIGEGIQQASEENPINTTEVDPKTMVPIGENHP